MESLNAWQETMALLPGTSVFVRLYTSGQALTTGSKSQYELHFKKWRLRKNLTKPEWCQIIRFMKGQPTDGDKIQVTFNGSVLSKERVARELARYGSIEQRHEKYRVG
jgi:hypothetical protein